MDSKHLRTFVAVANHSSFTGAAKELFIAQSAVSKHITQLEQELGVQLFLRDTRMVRLTDAGQQLYRDGVEILQRMDAALDHLRFGAVTQRGRLTVGVFSPLAGEVVELIRTFRSRYPDIDVVVEWQEFGQSIKMLEEGNLDVIFTMGFAVANKSTFHWAVVERGRLSVVVGRRSPLAGLDTISFSQLKGHRLFCMRPDVTADGYITQMALFMDRKFTPESITQYPNHESMLLQLQIHDDAYSLMVNYQYREHPGIAFVPLEDPIPQELRDRYALAAAWHYKNQNPGVSLLVELAKEV